MNGMMMLRRCCNYRRRLPDALVDPAALLGADMAERLSRHRRRRALELRQHFGDVVPTQVVRGDHRRA
jgi:hypothetical protein